jgi:nucleoside-diphosphate-sugar epimerase
MNILLTGATGFIGSHLYDLLNREHKLYSLVRNLAKAKNLGLEGELVAGDLSLESMRKWIGSLPNDIDVVIHTASILFSHDQKDYYQTNVELNIQFFELLKKRYPKLHFVFLSSQAALGPVAECEANEEAMPIPLSHYGKSKRLFEEFLEKEKPKAWTVSILRPPMVIGPRDTGMKDFFDLLKRNFVFIPGLQGLKNEYSFIGVFDLCQQVEKIVANESTESFSLYHLAYPQKITFAELVKVSKIALDKKFIIPLPMPLTLLSLLAQSLKLLSKFMPVKAQLNLDKVQELKIKSWVLKSIKIPDNSYQWNLERSLKSVLSK